ncbi:MAG TPA: TatD family hydrolase [Actinomycetota bacterium]|nr:TatD family hydrolase [Actinomycetota bacterium]
MNAWFDSHCHLHLCEEQEEVTKVMAHARAAGVANLLAVGIDVESSRRAAELAEQEGVVASAGVHPNSAAEFDDVVAGAVAELLAFDQVVAVGETGLDFYRDSCPAELQLEAFTAHIRLAKAHGLALVVHTRESVARALDLLEDGGAPERLVFHCWSGGSEDLRRALALGAFVSFAGNVSFPSAESLREAAAVVPEERLLVETDAPFLAPVPHRGEPNRPALLPFVGAAVASARGVEPEEVAALTFANAQALFGLG